MNRVLVVFSDGLLSELDSARGLVSRSAWIRQAVETQLMKEAVAPLVPEGVPTGVIHVPSVWTAETEEAMKAHWSKQKLTDEEWKALNEWQTKGLPSDLQDEEGSPLPKPRARRKNKIENVKGSGGSNPLSGATKRGDGMPQSALTPAESPSSGRPDRRKQLEPSGGPPPVGATVPLPARCNRGACAGTINPVSGRCLHCMQKPLKESK